MISTDLNDQLPPLEITITGEQLEIITDALVAFILHPGRFANPKPRQLLCQLEKARAKHRSQLSPNLQRASNTLEEVSPDFLLDLISFSHPLTAADVKPEAGLGADAPPQAVTSTAEDAPRAAKPRKPKSDKNAPTCRVS